jgi:hypothetical protein
MKLSKLYDVLFIISFFGMLAVPSVATLLNVKELHLNGTSVVLEKPKYSISTVWDGNYQLQYDTWFNSNFKMQSYLVRLCNQMRFTFFRTGGGSSNIVFGVDDYIFGAGEYCESALNLLYPRVSIETAQAYTDTIRRIQDKCDTLQKNFIFVIPAHKAMLIPNKIPLRYHVANIDNDINYSWYGTLKYCLGVSGVRFLDMPLLLSNYENKEQLVSKTGIHWNMVAAAITVLHLANGEFHTGLPHFEFEGVEELITLSDLSSSDNDIYNLSNLYRPLDDVKYYRPITKKGDGIPINLFITGTSFNEQIVQVLISAGLIDEINEVRYSSTLSDYSDYLHPQYSFYESSSIDFIGMIRSADLVIMTNRTDMFDENLAHATELIDKALDMMNYKQQPLPQDGSNLIIEINTEYIPQFFGRYISIPVTVTNNTPYPQYTAEPNPVYLTTHWKTDDGYVQYDNYLNPLPQIIMPGETVNAQINSYFAGEPGNYIVEITALQTNIMKYEDYNSEIIRTFDITYEGGE